MLLYSCHPFENLTVPEFYDVMVLRQEVFVVEQTCPFLDADGLDQAAWHLLGRNAEGRLLAYTRLSPPGDPYSDYSSIGRVVTAASARGAGLGKSLMETSIKMCHHLFGPSDIKIGAQTYLVQFYEDLGFVSTGEEYLEDGIPHTKMIYSFSGTSAASSQ